nr:hypothetical protein [Saccharomonospora iraqiensis]
MSPQKIRKHKAAIQTEEATKNAFVMPFISDVLGYDVFVFIPDEVIPKFTADVGVLLDDNDRKPIARLWFTAPTSTSACSTKTETRLPSRASRHLPPRRHAAGHRRPAYRQGFGHRSALRKSRLHDRTDLIGDLAALLPSLGGDDMDVDARRQSYPDRDEAGSGARDLSVLTPVALGTLHAIPLFYDVFHPLFLAQVYGDDPAGFGGVSVPLEPASAPDTPVVPFTWRERAVLTQLIVAEERARGDVGQRIRDAVPVSPHF